MNDRNWDLFFNEDSDLAAVITVTDEDGNEIDAEVIASIEIEELGKEYIAVLPQDMPENAENIEALLLEYTEDENGEPQFLAIEDEEEFEIASTVFDQFFAGETEESQEDEEESGFLDDIGNILSGVSFQKD